MELNVEFDKRKFDVVVKFWPRKARIEIGDALDHVGRKFLSEFRKQRLHGPPGIMAFPRGIFTTFKRTFLVSPTIEGMGTEIFTHSKVAQVHETGGIVRNPTGGRLAVPLSVREEMFTRKGQLKRKFKDPKSLRNVFPVKLNSKDFLVRRKRRETEITPLYVLKPFVRLKARLGFFKVWDSLENFRITRLQRAVLKTWDSI